MSRMMFPVGIDSFEKLRQLGCYYIDKTKFIEELLQDTFEVNLITRPRRFGKTLAMSMLADFFDIRKDSRAIFEGLMISENKELCREWMNQWPVLFLTLKNVEDLNYENAYGQLVDTISNLCMQHTYLETSEKVDSADVKRFMALKEGNAKQPAVKNSLFILMRMMRAHFGKPVILLIDEYDVPLARASENGFYEQMLGDIRGIIGKAVKSNEYLKFAVVTGCLRIAKESIFTGTNNFISNSISDLDFCDYFGFTQMEVNRLLSDCGLEGQADKIQKWYDGYRFGKNEIYCPWDVLNHVRRLQKQPAAEPENYWKNTSHNGIIRSFIDHAQMSVSGKFETLLGGGSIQTEILEDMTYDVLHSSESNFWSILYLTGYLTLAVTEDETNETGAGGGMVFLRIPNEEIKSIFADTVAAWFSDNVREINRRPLFDAFWNGDDREATRLTADILFNTISYFDYKEDYYHAFLAGIFTGAEYEVESNKEYGLGRQDIVVRDRVGRRVIIIEIKHSGSEKELEKDSNLAINQINVKEYVHQFLKGYHKVLCYGAAFYEKECFIQNFR